MAPAVIVVAECGGAVDPSIPERPGEDRLNVPEKRDWFRAVGRRGQETAFDAMVKEQVDSSDKSTS
jgi:hypothetical protein